MHFGAIQRRECFIVHRQVSKLGLRIKTFKSTQDTMTSTRGADQYVPSRGFDTIQQPEECFRTIPPNTRPQLPALDDHGFEFRQIDGFEDTMHIRFSGLSGDGTNVVRFVAVRGTEKIGMAHIEITGFASHGIGERIVEGFGNLHGDERFGGEDALTPPCGEMDGESGNDPPGKGAYVLARFQMVGQVVDTVCRNEINGVMALLGMMIQYFG